MHLTLGHLHNSPEYFTYGLMLCHETINPPLCCFQEWSRGPSQRHPKRINIGVHPTTNAYKPACAWIYVDIVRGVRGQCTIGQSLANKFQEPLNEILQRLVKNARAAGFNYPGINWLLARCIATSQYSSSYR